MVKYVKGNLLESNCDYICHQVNCQGVMGSGIAKQIKDKWPEVYEHYLEFCGDFEYDPDELLGKVDFVKLNSEDRYAVNMYSQNTYGYDGQRYTSYDAFAYALEVIEQDVPDGYTIGFPKNIGCGLGGGDWRIVSAMIEAILGETHEVYIYEYDPKED